MEMLLESKGFALSLFFHINLLDFLKIQNVIKSHSLMPGRGPAINVAIFIFLTCFPNIGFLKVSIAHTFLKSWSHHGLIAKGLLALTCHLNTSGLVESHW